MRKKFTSVLLFLAMGIGVASAQDSKITGKVIDENGEPVIGASIVVRGTTVGTVSDIDGNFTLEVPADGKHLMISYIGMRTQQVDIAPNVTVRLLNDTQNLDEVVVTAMGISKEKKALGYAVQDVKSEELTQAANTSLASAMQGKVSGVDIAPSSGMPGASAKITIRGSRSFTGDNTPLYVVDGMPIASTADVDTGSSVSGSDFANRAVDLDPNDIESINILKGQAASALYGMRAANGVIVITTKSGKGAAKGKPQVSFSTNLSFDKISTLPELQKEYAQGSGGVFNPNTSSVWGPKISELPNDATYGGNTDNAYTRQYGMQQGKYYVPQRANAGMDPWAVPQAYDNAKEFFNTGMSWSNSVNIRQAFDRGNYSFSLGNTTTDGIVPSTGMDRYNAKLSGTAQLHKNWQTGFSGNYVTSKITKQTAANSGIMATVYGAPPSYDLAGIPSHIEGDPYTQNNFRGGSFDNAYWAVENNEFTERSQRFFGNTYIQYNTRFNTDNHQLTVKWQGGVDSYTTNYTDLWGYGHAGGRGEITEYHYTVNEFNSLFTAAYSWNINEDLVFDALVGNEIVDNKKKYSESYGMNFNFSGWNHIDNASVYSASGTYRKKRTVGNFANVSLAWRNMLYFNATVRNDIVSSMPRDNRSFTYPSVSLGWIFTELEPLKNEILTYGKFRGSYAEVGMAGDYYQSYYRTPSVGSGFSSGTPVMYPLNGVTAYTPYSVVYDPNLKPQNTKSWELGGDLGFFDGLINFNYTFSRQDTKDQIFEVPLAGSTGFGSLMTNGGSMYSNTHEFTLQVNPINTKNFKWDFAFNFSKINNYVEELAEGVESIFLGGFTEPQVRAGIGYKFPVIYGVSFLRDDAGNLIVDEQGLPQAGEEKVIGTVSPDFQLGFNTTFEFYKFRLSAVLDWKQGGQIYAATGGLLDYYGTSQKSADYRSMDYFIVDGVKADGTKNDIKIYGQFPAGMSEAEKNKSADAQDYFSTLNDISESMIQDNSFLKLREISLSYPVWDKNSLKVNVSVFARNILLWSELKGYDPEASQGNNNMGGGFERFSLPGTSSYGFGINVNF
ncbi:MAG TPA: SusC/RagA family TonB-linked outer membrane protein [Candidatus Parabacteroides intestinigallinarum]|uniref:SusC/RagA family TonB-linked outer membrane protein n=1 Tax=Candidatus Parabacteroides intestinigallinarum TaxID=2838722 RepID=A0A9D1XRQ7_9BACT|nr:SusC/RagA family TonB-linked outer membrane protein [Candidatus Parabacteroides intestinigallinarum]